MHSPLTPPLMHTAPSAKFLPPDRSSDVSLQVSGDDDDPHFALHGFLEEVPQNLSSFKVGCCGKKSEKICKKKLSLLLPVETSILHSFVSDEHTPLLQ